MAADTGWPPISAPVATASPPNQGARRQPHEPATVLGQVAEREEEGGERDDVEGRPGQCLAKQ